MTTRDRLLEEMSLLTGVLSNDYEYLLSLILIGDRKGTSKKIVEYEAMNDMPAINCLTELDKWFATL